MLRRLLAWIQKHERRISALAMIGGAVVDQLFFGRIDLLQTQAVFASYTAVCFITIPLLEWIEARAARGMARPRWRALLPIATQFSLGGFWSGFLVFYGRSAAISAAWPFLLLIIGILVLNEVLKKYHERLVFTSVLFFFAVYTYAIFAIPLFTGTIGTLTFLESGAAAVVLFGLFTMLLRIVGKERFYTDVWRIRLGAFLVLLIINVSYFANILPPLPLSAKAAGVYHTVWHVPGAYLGTSEAQNWEVRFLGFDPTFHVVTGESLYAYSSVFAPAKLSTTIVHRWQWYDPAAKRWVTRAAISYPIEGGRDGGYRGYSAVLMNTPGQWRVNIETAEGLLIARIPFTVDQVALPPALTTETLP